MASFPEEIPGDDLIRAFTLTGADRDLVAIRRGAANRLRLALLSITRVIDKGIPRPDFQPVALGDCPLHRGPDSLSPTTRPLDRWQKAAEEAKAEARGLWAVDGFRCLPSGFREGYLPPALNQLS